MPVLDNGELQLVAEDGRRYSYSEGGNTTLYSKTSYSVLLPALKTVDAVWTPTAPGSYSLYDRRLGLSNGTSASSGTGGMLVHLDVQQEQ